MKTKHILYRLFLAMFVLIGFANTASAKIQCANRDIVVQNLKKHFSEEQISKKTEAFTILLSGPNNVSCVVSSGIVFFMKPEKVIVVNIPPKKQGRKTGFKMHGERGDGAKQLRSSDLRKKNKGAVEVTVPVNSETYG